jgi:hypothetical protein
VRAGADDFLERDEVGIDGPDHVRDTRGQRASVEATAAMDVVGGDADRPLVRITHEVKSTVMQNSECRM